MKTKVISNSDQLVLIKSDLLNDDIVVDHLFGKNKIDYCFTYPPFNKNSMFRWDKKADVQRTKYDYDDFLDQLMLKIKKFVKHDIFLGFGRSLFSGANGEKDYNNSLPNIKKAIKRHKGIIKAIWNGVELNGLSPKNCGFIQFSFTEKDHRLYRRWFDDIPIKKCSGVEEDGVYDILSKSGLPMENKTIVDFCIGKGATSVAGIKLRMKKVYGLDINEPYLLYNQKRILKLLNQMTSISE